MALDVDADRARRWVDVAQPTHPSLLDRAHVVDELLGIVNVPNGVWIDEQATIVRPAEPAHVVSRDVRDQRMRQLERESPERAPTYRAARRIPTEAERYVPALRDWVEKGGESAYALSPEEVVERSGPRSPQRAQAACRFELGEYLHERGHVEAAQGHWREAHRLYPENWTYRRQAWELLDPGGQGRSDVYEGSWLDEIEKLGPENYYPPLQL